jgi:hypothetical protein
MTVVATIFFAFMIIGLSVKCREPSLMQRLALISVESSVQQTVITLPAGPVQVDSLRLPWPQVFVGGSGIWVRPAIRDEGV